MIIVLGCVVKPMIPAGGLLSVVDCADATSGGFPGADVFCADFVEGEGAMFAPGGGLVDG